MRYFITGGAGFIGANFVEALISTFDPDLEAITVFDKLTYAGNPRNLQKSLQDPRVKLVIGDICDSETLRQEMIGHDVVLNFAAESHVDRSINSAEHFVKTNILGAFNVLEMARSVKIKTIVHISTDEVYGSLKGGAAHEEYPLLPNSPYAASKAASDLIVRSFITTYGMDIRITRCCNNYGKYQFTEKFIPVIINSLINGKDIPVYGNGNNFREWIHVNDHCLGIWTVLTLGTAGETYNIGTDTILSNIELVNSLSKTFGLSDSKIKFVTDRLGHDYRYSLDSKKIRSLGWSPKIEFASGIRETIQWYKDHIANWWEG